MDLVLAVDLGTTSIKALVLSTDGEVLADAAQEYELRSAPSGQVEFSVDEYWATFASTVRRCTQSPKVDRAAIRGLGLSVQGETLVCVDDAGRPTRPAISWLDNRASAEAEMLRAEFTDAECFARTGQVSFTPTWPAAKVLWLVRNQPDVMQASARVLLLEDFFLYRLTGKYACEPSLVCSTAYWDLLAHHWWTEVLEFIGLHEDQLAEPMSSGELLGTLTSAVAAELGLSTAVGVCVGGLDQACAAIGVGNIAQGVLSENTGAALAICATVDSPVFDPQGRMPLHAHAIPDHYMLHSFTSGGIVLRWFRDRFCVDEMAVAELLGSDAYSMLSAEAAGVTPGCDGLVTLPHIQGAMAPENDSDARAVFVGITMHHTKAHFVRSIMEAVACAIRRNLDVISDLGVEVTELRSTGGAAASDVWSQIKADVTGRVTRTMRHSQAACIGAGMLAGVGVGVFRDIPAAVGRFAETAGCFTPDRERRAAYEAVYRRYGAVYEALAPVFPTLAQSPPLTEVLHD